MNLRSVLALYHPQLLGTVISKAHDTDWSGWRLFHWFWTTKSYEPYRKLTDTERSTGVVLALGLLVQIALGVGLLVQWARFGSEGLWAFGLALLLSYPIVWAHVVIIFCWVTQLIWAVLHPKAAARSVVCTVLEMQVRQLRKRHQFKVVAVVGSLGKTSTKYVIAQMLEHNLRVRYQAGNYNDRVTVPLVFFGMDEPSLYNVFAWLKIFGVTQSEIAMDYPYDVVVLELGSDGPGQIEKFAYLAPDITVVTAVAEEHMEYFGTLDAVAAEELAVFDYSKQVLVNGDDVSAEYLVGRTFSEYSVSAPQAPYYLRRRTARGLNGQMLDLQLGKHEATAETQLVGEQSAKFVLAAAAVADNLGISAAKIAKTIPKLVPFAGRMQILPGVQESTLVDDTYNAAPISVKAALDVVYAAVAPQKIAILGSINEMGNYAKQAHTEVGEYCDPKKLDMVVTVGKDAKKWLAPAAKARGCAVHEFLSPYEAGEFVRTHMNPSAVVLAKGSQNGVFTEESLKLLLANPDDASKLVRQSPYWLARKAKQFPSVVE